MKIIILICALAAVILFGYFELKRLGAFLENNQKLIDDSKEREQLNSEENKEDNP